MKLIPNASLVIAVASSLLTMSTPAIGMSPAERVAAAFSPFTPAKIHRVKGQLLPPASPTQNERPVLKRVLLIKGLGDYIPGTSPMLSLAQQLQRHGYEVTITSHLTSNLYDGIKWFAVIGHSIGAYDAIAESSYFAKQSPAVAIIAIDPPAITVGLRCTPGVRYLDIRASAGLAGKLSCGRQIVVPGDHVTAPERADVQQAILNFLG